MNSVLVINSGLGDLINGQLICWTQFAGQRKRKQMFRERPAESFLFRNDCILEFHGICKGVTPKELATGIDRSAVVVRFSPFPNGVEILQCETQGVNSFVTSSAVSPLAMRRQPFSKCQVLFAFRRLFR